MVGKQLGRQAYHAAYAQAQKLMVAGLVGAYALLTAEEMFLSLVMFRKHSWMVSMSAKKAKTAARQSVQQSLKKQ